MPISYPIKEIGQVIAKSGQSFVNEPIDLNVPIYKNYFENGNAIEIVLNCEIPNKENGAYSLQINDTTIQESDSSSGPGKLKGRIVIAADDNYIYILAPYSGQLSDLYNTSPISIAVNWNESNSIKFQLTGETLLYGYRVRSTKEILAIPDELTPTLDSATELNIKNPDAENEVEGWNTFNGFTSTTGNSFGSPYEGNRCFYGGDNTLLSSAEQIINLPSNLYFYIDNSNIKSSVSYYQYVYTSENDGRLNLYALDARMNVIKSSITPLQSPRSWTQRNNTIVLPSKTRKIKIEMEGDSQGFGTNNLVYFDKLSGIIYQ